MLIGCHLMEINCYYLVLFAKVFSFKLKGIWKLFHELQLNYYIRWICSYPDPPKLNEFSCIYRNRTVFNIILSPVTDCIATFIQTIILKTVENISFLTFIQLNVQSRGVNSAQTEQKLNYEKKTIRQNFPNKHYVIQNEAMDNRKKAHLTPTKQQERIKRKMFPHSISFYMNFISPKFYFLHSLLETYVYLIIMTWLLFFRNLV